MAHSQRSLSVTDAYRARLLSARDRALRDTTERWRQTMPQGLDAESWVGFAAVRVAQAQTEALRATAGYLIAFLASELGRRERGPRIDTARYVGHSRDGRLLQEVLRSPIIGTKAALKDGRDIEEALAIGLQRAELAVGMDVDQAARQALTDVLAEDERFVGWQRALAGTCGACAAVAGRTQDAQVHFAVHPGCRCVQEPVVRGVSNRFPRPTGEEFFGALTIAEQNEMVGEDKAKLVRSGQVPLSALASESDLATEPDWITETPLEALHPMA